MRKSRIALALLLGGALGVGGGTVDSRDDGRRGGAVESTILYDNFGPDDTHSVMTYWAAKFELDRAGGLETWAQADSFVVPDVDYTLATIEVAASEWLGEDELDVWLYDDQNGKPGEILESFHASDEMGPIGELNPPLLFESAGTLLEANQRYWIVMQPSEPNSAALWAFNVTDDVGEHAMQTDGVTWDIVNDTRGTYRVTATEGDSTCPLELAVRQSRRMLDEVLPFDAAGILSDVRRFRDQVLLGSADGRALAGAYDRHAAELKRLLARDPSLAFETVAVVSQLLPALRDAASGSVVLSPADYRRGERLLEKYTRAASPQLAAALDDVSRFLERRMESKSTGEVQVRF